MTDTPATDHTLTDAEHDLVLHAAIRSDLDDLARSEYLDAAVESILASRLATAEAEKEALRAEVTRHEQYVTVLLNRSIDTEAALAGLVAAVEALADGPGSGFPYVQVADLRALIDADHAAALRAREAKALRDAAEAALAHYGTWGGAGWADWLRARADSIEQARP